MGIPRWDWVFTPPPPKNGNSNLSEALTEHFTDLSMLLLNCGDKDNIYIIFEMLKCETGPAPWHRMSFGNYGESK